MLTQPSSQTSIQNAQSLQNYQLYKSPGIKIVSQEENRSNLANRGRVQHISINAAKMNGHTNIIRIPAKGINVTTSRQSSTERPSSRNTSNEKQDQKEITSQTHLNAENFKKMQIINELKDKYEEKAKQQFQRLNMYYSSQIQRLREIIQYNQSKIGQYDAQINHFQHKIQKKEKSLQKMEYRLTSLEKYHQQCYSYTLRRLQDLQFMFNSLCIECHQNLNPSHLQNKLKNIQLVLHSLIESYLSQSYLFKHEFAEQIGKKMEQMRKLQSKLNGIELIGYENKARQIKLSQMEKQIQIINKQIQSKITMDSTIEIDDLIHLETNFKEIRLIKDKIKRLQERIIIAQRQKQRIHAISHEKQETAKNSIWQLSNLLNTLQRQNENIKKINENQDKYIAQIQNKLIQLKLTKPAPIKQSENSIILHQKVHLQNLNKIATMSQKIIDLEQKNKKLERQESQNKEKVQELLDMVSIIEQKSKSKVFSFAETQTQKLNQPATDSLSPQKINQLYENKIAELEEEMQKVEKSLFQKENAFQQAIQTNMELKYSLQRANRQISILQNEVNHLKDENDEFKASMNEYAHIFQKQSCTFKTAIQKLRQQNESLKKSLQQRKQPLLSPRSISSLDQLKRSISNDQTMMSRSIQSHSGLQPLTPNKAQKLIRLKRAIEQSGLKCPLKCEVDGTGYLKHYDQGTYIVDCDENLFELDAAEIGLAVKIGVITMFQ